MKYLGKIEHDKDLINKEYGDNHYFRQLSTMPTASAEWLGKIVQYVGSSTGSYQNGSIYKCVNRSGIYSWNPTSTTESYTKDESDNRYLKLEGGTMTGDLAVNSGSGSIKASTSDEFIVMNGGTTYADGSWIQLIGKDYVSNKGEFFLAANDGNTTKMLVGSPSGSLKWDDTQLLNQETGDNRYLKREGGTMTGAINMNGKKINSLPTPTTDNEPTTKAYVDDKVDDCLPLTGGTMTGAIQFNAMEPYISNAADNSYTSIWGADHYNNGCFMHLYGKNTASAYAGGFYIRTRSNTKLKEFVGLPDGTLTWGDDKVALTKTAKPTLTARSGWTMWGDCTPICGNLYYLNYTFKNDTGSIQGASDLQIADCNGSAGDGAFATACYEALDSVIGCVMQTNILKFRTSANKIPIGAYIPVSGVLSWTP